MSQVATHAMKQAVWLLREACLNSTETWLL